MSITFFILFILFNISFSFSEKILVIFLYGNERKLLLSVEELFILWNVNAFNEFTLEGSKLNFDLSISFSVSILLSVFNNLSDGWIFVPISLTFSFL